MLSERHLCVYLFCVLSGSLALAQETNYNEQNTSSTEALTRKSYFFYQPPTYPRDCKEAFNQCSARNSNGVFVIKPDGYPHPFEVYCNNNVDTGGWTVVMRHLDGSIGFTRNWTEYKEGFGFLGSEFWIGNEKLSFLTNQRQYELRIDLTVSNGTTAFMRYSHFRLNDEWGNFSLISVGNATGNANFLAPICPSNMLYTTCVCERTCEAPTICQNNCQEAKRCRCPDGFFLKGSDCVVPEECECYSRAADKVIPVNETYVDNQCTSQCSCSESGLTCSNYACDSYATCTTSSSGGGQCVCNAGLVGDGVNCTCSTGYLFDGSRCRRPRDCDEVPSVIGYSGSGSYYILPNNWQAFRVYCNMSEGRWTVLQRRIPESSRNFYLYWNSYKGGFGELDEDFWLGNDKIYHLTNQRDYQLRIDIIDSGNRHYRAQYNRFRIDNENNKYRITELGTYSGNAGYDAMRHHLNQPFSTRDRDNDDWSGLCGGCCSGSNCAILHQGGWWYKYRGYRSGGACDHYYYGGSCYCSYSCGCYGGYYSCTYSNLNGDQDGSSGRTIFWHGLAGNDCGIKYTEMKIRPL